MRLVPVLLLLFAALLAGCASDDSSGDPPATTSPATPTGGAASGPVALEVRTSGAYPVNPGFSPATLEAKSGAPVTVKFTNAEAAPLVNHDWVLDGVEGAATQSLAPGASEEVTFTAPAPGEYEYFCSIGDHRSRGMVGKLTVT